MEQRPEQTQEITAEQLSELLQVRRDKLAALVADTVPTSRRISRLMRTRK